MNTWCKMYQYHDNTKSEKNIRQILTCENVTLASIKSKFTGGSKMKNAILLKLKQFHPVKGLVSEATLHPCLMDRFWTVLKDYENSGLSRVYFCWLTEAVLPKSACFSLSMSHSPFFSCTFRAFWWVILLQVWVHYFGRG